MVQNAIKKAFTLSSSISLKRTVGKKMTLSCFHLYFLFSIIHLPRKMIFELEIISQSTRWCNTKMSLVIIGFYRCACVVSVNRYDHYFFHLTHFILVLWCE
jgi:hypothetical protein